MLSNEAILFQSNSDITKSLVTIVEGVLESGELYDLNEITKYLSKRTGIKLEVNVFTIEGSGPSHRVGVDIPNLNALSPLNKTKHSMDRIIALHKEGYKVVSPVTGMIDPKAVRVTGFYSTIVFKLDLNSNLFDGLFTAREIVAIIAHEIGHAWDYMESLGESVTANHLLTETIRIFGESKDVEKKFELVKSISPATASTVEDPSTLTQEEIITLMEVGKEERQLVAANGSFAEVHMDELAGDQFANRLGLGGELVSALTKIIKNSKWFRRPSAYKSKWVGGLLWATDVLLLPLYAVQTINGAGMLVATKLIKNQAMNIALPLGMSRMFGHVTDFDTRVKNIVFDLRGLLRDPNIGSNEKTRILGDLRLMEEAMSTMKRSVDSPRMMLAKFITTTLSKGDRQGRRDMGRTELSNNRLYELSLRLKKGVF